MFEKFFIPFLHSTSNFQQFERKDEPQSCSNSEIIYSNKRAYFNCLKDCVSGHPRPNIVLLKSASSTFLPITSSICETLNWKKFLLVRYDIVGLCLKTMNADDKYSCYRRKIFLHVNQFRTPLGTQFLDQS